LAEENLEEPDKLPDPDVLAQEPVEDFEAALEQFREIAADLRRENGWFFVDRHNNIVIEAALCREFLVINKLVAYIT
jgi:hypothetical protein